MNPSTKSRRGRGVHATKPPSVPAPVARGAAIRAGASLSSICPPDASLRQTDTPPVGGWWSMASPNEGVYPPGGGFSHFLQSNTFANYSDGNKKSHFVGAAMSPSSFSPQSLGATTTPSRAQQTDHIVNDLDEEEEETINIDNDSRTDKRLNWTVPEDIRLASAWLHNSKDPVDGNGRKADAYWTDVTEEYNKSTETSRKRNRNQLKIRWDRSKKPLSDFHGCWVNASRVWQSGISDDQLIERH